MDQAQLKELSVFSGLSRRQRQTIAQHADEIAVPAGGKLVEQNRLANELYVIKTGSAEVFDGEDLINVLGPGDVIGEIGVLETHKRTATVIATSETSAIVMYGPELTALKNAVPALFDKLEELVRNRLNNEQQDRK